MSNEPRNPEDQLRQFASSFSDVVSSFGKKVGGMMDGMFASDESGELSTPVDAYYAPAQFVIEVELPGVLKEDVSLQIIDQVLSLKGVKKMPAGTEAYDFVGRERRYGAFIRTLELPTDIDLAQIKAKYEHGVLRITFARTSPDVEPGGIQVDVE